MTLSIHEETECLDRLYTVRKSADEECEKELHFYVCVVRKVFQFFVGASPYDPTL